MLASSLRDQGFLSNVEVGRHGKYRAVVIRLAHADSRLRQFLLEVAFVSMQGNVGDFLILIRHASTYLATYRSCYSNCKLWWVFPCPILLSPLGSAGAPHSHSPVPSPVLASSAASEIQQLRSRAPCWQVGVPGAGPSRAGPASGAGHLHNSSPGHPTVGALLPSPERSVQHG